MTTPDPAVAERLAFAEQLAESAGRVTLERFGTTDLGVETKADGSPVSLADRAAETHIRAALAERFPGDAILGEEFGEQPGTTRIRWVLDPIDGTASFIRGVPLYGTMISIEHNGTPAAAVVRMPALGEAVSGGTGIPGRHLRDGHDPAPARVSTATDTTDAIFASTSRDYFADTDTGAVYDALCAGFARSRGWSDCYAYVLLATGRLEAVVETGLQPWDWSPLVPIVEAAGGTITGWDGGPIGANGDVVATNTALHEKTLRLVADSRPKQP